MNASQQRARSDGRRMQVHYLVSAGSDSDEIGAFVAGLKGARADGHDKIHRSFLDTFDERLAAAGRSLEADLLGRNRYLIQLRHGGSENVDWMLSAAALPRFAEAIARPRIRARLRRITAARALLVQATVAIRIRRYRIIGPAEKTIAQVLIEEYSSRRLHRRGTPLIAVRLQPVTGFEHACRPLVTALTRAPGLTQLAEDLATLVKRELGWAPSGYWAKPVVPLDGHAASGTSLAQILSAYWEVMRANETGILADIDSEFLHDFRVALRSIRSVFNALHNVVPKSARKRFKTEFAWLNRVTGQHRDYDVLEYKLSDYFGTRGLGADPDSLPALRALIEHDRNREHQHLVAHLQSGQYRAFNRGWAKLLRAMARGRARGKHAALPVRQTADSALAGCLAAVLAFEWSQAHDDLSALHGLRKACKKLRYLLEAFQSLYDDRLLKRAVADLKDLQTVMGDTWDLHVHHELLHKFARRVAHDRALSAALGPALAGLDATLATRQEALLAGVTRQLERFRRKATQRLYARLLSGSAP